MVRPITMPSRGAVKSRGTAAKRIGNSTQFLSPFDLLSHDTSNCKMPLCRARTTGRARNLDRGATSGAMGSASMSNAHITLKTPFTPISIALSLNRNGFACFVQQKWNTAPCGYPGAAIRQDWCYRSARARQMPRQRAAFPHLSNLCGSGANLFAEVLPCANQSRAYTDKPPHSRTDAPTRVSQRTRSDPGKDRFKSRRSGK